MSYSNVYFNSRDSTVQYWEYENDEKVQRSVAAPLYFYVASKNGEFTTVDGRKAKRIDCDTSGEFRQKIKDYKQMEYETFESDVSIETKFIVDKYLGQDLKIPNLDIHQLDIEVHSEKGFPRADEANFPVVLISVWSTRNKKFSIFAEKTFDTSMIEEDHELIVEADEKELLKRYIAWVHDECPDIITGWNSNGFDIPYIINRTKQLLGDKWVKRLSPLNKVREVEVRINAHQTEIRYLIAGISCLDMLEIYKNYTFAQRENYRLGYITTVELGEDITKNEYEGSIADFYNNDWQGYAEYNIQDVRLLTDLENKLGYINMLVTFCYGCRVPFEHYQKTTKVLDGAFVAELTKEGIVVPDVNRGLRDVKYPGGYVMDPDRGMHDWVASFDATSLYPSIMMGWNISPETKKAVLNKKALLNIYNCFVEKAFDGKQKFMYDGEEWFVSDFCDEIKRDKGRFDMKAVNKNGGFHAIANENAVVQVRKCLAGKDFDNIDVAWNDELVDVKRCAKKIKDKEYCLASNGAIYSQDSQGVIPRFVKKWFDQRRTYKNEMLKYEKLASEAKGKNAKKYEEYTQEVSYYKLLQMNYKILINSVYGYLGTVYSRFYDFDNCVAVTTTGQTITKTVKGTLNNYFKKAWPKSKLGKKLNAAPIDKFVIYGDTDSVYLDFSKLLTSIKFKYKDKPLDKVKNFIIYNKQKTNEEIFGEIDESGTQTGGFTLIERTKLEETCSSLQNFVSNFINESMKDLTIVKCNCKSNLISFKREVVASSGCFLAPKRYCLHALNSEGTEMDKLKTTGLDLVRSSTPIIVQDALKKIILGILKETDESKAKEQLRDFRKKFFSSDPFEIARPSGINNLDEYTERMDNDDYKAIPAHVKSAYIYNNMLEEYPEISSTYDKIYNGTKIKWLYLKNNSLQKNETIAFVNKLPVEFNLHEYVDYDTQFEKTFIAALKSMYEAVGWQMPNLATVDNESLFDW